jgi:UPF0176 protein
MEKIIVAAFYKFVELKDRPQLQKHLNQACQQVGVKGIILLAPEGINSTIAGTRSGIDSILSLLRQDERFHDLEHKESYCQQMPFRRLKVRLKKEIITMGLPEVDPTKVVGTYVDPQDWNKLVSDPDVIVIDTRNDYEVQIGTFKHALDPKTQHFGDFARFVKEHLDPQKHKKIAMCCTGGIRCEKASSYMKLQGFEEVYHLKGGILKYLEEIPQEESLWQGECFVFDERISVKHGLEVGGHDLCYGCRRPVSQVDKTSPLYQPGVSCSQCYLQTTDEQKNRFSARQRQIQLLKTRQQKLTGASHHEKLD